MIQNKNNRHAHERGFSLLELLVAAVVSSIVLLMIHSAYRSIIYSVQDMTGIAEFYENINLSIRRIDRDIQCSLTHMKNDRLFFTGDNSVSPPYKGNLDFVTVMKSDLFVAGTINDPVHMSDVRGVSYFLKEDPAYQNLFFLMRSESPMYDKENSHTGRSSILLENVEDIRFEFGSKNSSNWDARWDLSTLNRYPSAVRTTLTVKNYRGVSETFTFISLIDKEL